MSQGKLLLFNRLRHPGPEVRRLEPRTEKLFGGLKISSFGLHLAVRCTVFATKLRQIASVHGDAQVTEPLEKGPLGQS